MIGVTLANLALVVGIGLLMERANHRRRDEQIRRAYHDYPAATREWLRGESCHLPGSTKS